MATRRRTRQSEARLAFEAISIEGGLLSAEWLARIAQLAAGQQAEADYRIPKGLNLRDELGRYWRIAQAHWAEFVAARAGDGDRTLVAQKFLLALLRDCLGFASLAPVEPVVISERTYPIGNAALGQRVPVVIGPAPAKDSDESSLDDTSAAYGDAGRRRSPFGLAQEFLNAAEGALWGIASDGVRLRILRDNSSLTRPAWIEVDLARIFLEQRYADFTAFWLVAHESRFGRADQPPTECALESWRSGGREEGTRAREQLRSGVEDALLELGQGFLEHRDNAALREALQTGALTPKQYFQELLRLVYRLIFLLTVEERGLLHAPDATDDAKRLYGDGYALRRLRERSVRRSAHDRFADLWEGLRIVFRGLATGEQILGLPALAGIFAASQTPRLDASRIENHRLLTAVFRLSWLREDSGLSRVNWRDMGPEELGSVYESLLELVPQLSNEGRTFGFAGGAEAKGNARKTSGSYYTPDSLVQVMLESALEPVVARTIAENPKEPVSALLQLTIVDPACGSGHFLLAAARRLAAHVARLRANGTPSPAEHRHALREVVGRCVFGVDLNPMAVELCKVALWMEAVEPGRPLSFLDSHIQQGNALLGTTPELMKEGIPDEAWTAIEGDDKKTASALKKRNKLELNQQSLNLRSATDEVALLTQAVATLDQASDADSKALAEKATNWEQLRASEAYRHQKLVADAWCAAFVWPKTGSSDPVAEAAPTNAVWRQLRDDPKSARRVTVQTVERLAKDFEFFHWRLAFPQVFQRGGFDVVVGNPPWDSLTFGEEEFFAVHRPDIANARTAAIRKRMIGALEKDDTRLFDAYRSASRQVAGANAFVRSGLPFPFTGLGRVNLYALFAELGMKLLSRVGRVGQILPSGIVSDDSTKLLFQKFVSDRRLISFYDFENREGLFPSVDSRMKFGLLTVAGEPDPARESQFVFFALSPSDLRKPERRFSLSAEDFALLNPQTRTCPVFRSARDANITKAVYRHTPVLKPSEWHVDVRRLLNSADDSDQFKVQPNRDLLPVFEAKYYHHFNHRWATSEADRSRDFTDEELRNPEVSVHTRNWFPERAVQDRFGSTWKHPWVLASRKITRSTDERTFIATVVPSLAVTDSSKVYFLPENHVGFVPALLANLCSFVFDYIARQKIGGTDMSAFIVEQLPVLPRSEFEQPAPWDKAKSLNAWVWIRSLELAYTAFDLRPYARDVGYEGSPFKWNAERRFLLRAELDAAFFHQYRVSRDDVAYILDTFPIVRKNDEKAHGEFRTKRVILESYDAMAEAIRTGKPYKTLLSPPPADPSLTHTVRKAAS